MVNFNTTANVNLEPFWTVGAGHSAWLWVKTQEEAQAIADKYKSGNDSEYKCDENSLRLGVQIAEWLPGTWEDIGNECMQLIVGVPQLSHCFLIRFGRVLSTDMMIEENFHWRDIRLLVGDQEVLVSSSHLPSVAGRSMTWDDLFNWLRMHTRIYVFN